MMGIIGIDEKKGREMGKFYVGFDIGSFAVHGAVVGEGGRVVYVPRSLPHFGDPLGCLLALWRDVAEAVGEEHIASTAFTGIGAASFPKVFDGLLFDYDSVTIPKGAAKVAPDVTYVFHIGAKDSYFFRIEHIEGQPAMLEWSANSKCGGGSGTLLEKQVRRLYGDNSNSSDDEAELLEQLFREAESEAALYEDLAGYNARCGVVVQSDLIHEQNEGAKRPYLLARLYATVARNYKNDVIGPRELKKEAIAIATGGAFGSDFILHHVQELAGVKLRRLEAFRSVGAIGAALLALEKKNDFVVDFSRMGEIASYAREHRLYADPLKGYLDKVHVFSDAPVGMLPKGSCDVTIGVDGGSTTTKAAVIDIESGALLDKIYISTHGDPEGALRKVFQYLARNKDRYNVRGICTTGSARKLYERILVSKSKAKALEEEGYAVPDGAVDEITCHAYGIKFHDPDIDTVFEVGGQDMKFTTFKRRDGKATDEVAEARMNYSCQAGAGQTLENMALLLGLDVKDSLQEYALKADRVPLIDATCGVFMEMEENRLIAEGFSKEEIAAAIVRATAASYYQKFVGGPQYVQEKPSCQGGPALGLAFLAAMAQVTGNDIYAYPHRELFGAWGAALVSRERVKELELQGKAVRSAYRGWEWLEESFARREVFCLDHFGPLSCGVRNCKLKIFTIGQDEVITGGFCPRGNSEGSGNAKRDYVELYHKLLEKHFDGVLYQKLGEAKLDEFPTIGIRRSGVALGELGVWAGALFKALGFLPVLTPLSDERIAQLGINLAHTEFCIAMKLVVGHGALLNGDERIRYIFNPSFIEEVRTSKPNRKFCIYTEAEGYMLQDILGIDRSREVIPVWHLGDEDQMVESLKGELERLGLPASVERIKEAFRYADSKKEAFLKEVSEWGDRFLEELEESGEVGYVGLGREYVVLDPEASSRSGQMFSKERGMRYIPQAFLHHLYKDIPIDDLVFNEYWYQNAAILQAAVFVARHPRLFPIRQMNFACGPDSMKFYHEKLIFDRAEKPFLHLVTDAQTNNAPFVTRAEAHERVVSRARPRRDLDIYDFALFKEKASGSLNLGKRRWLIPYMGEASRFGAAAVRHLGLSASIIPTNTVESREYANKFITTETCFPLRGVVGDVLAHLEELARERGKDWVKENCLVFLPTTSGPCRFGKYGEVLKIFLAQLGYEGLPVLGPSSDSGYLDFEVPAPLKGFFKQSRALIQVFNAIKMNDMLDDLVRRFRPYCRDKAAFDRLYEKEIVELERLIEEKGAFVGTLKEWSRKASRRFAALTTDAHERFPLVLYVGEIYTRQHDPYANNVIRRLEEEGLEVIRGSISEWIEYVNYTTYRENPHWIHKVADLYLSFADWRFHRLFGETNGERKVLPKPEQIIEGVEAAGVYHGDITGESPLVIGIFRELMEGRLPSKNGAKVCGIFHVGPFTCMQEGVAMAKMDAMLKEAQKKNPNLMVPVIHAFFGDSANPNLEAEIAAFREQCYLKARLA